MQFDCTFILVVKVAKSYIAFGIDPDFLNANKVIHLSFQCRFKIMSMSWSKSLVLILSSYSELFNITED